MSFATVIENSPCAWLVSNHSVGACKAHKVTLVRFGSGGWSVQAHVPLLPRAGSLLSSTRSLSRHVHGHLRVSRPYVKGPVPITPALVPDGPNARVGQWPLLSGYPNWHISNTGESVTRLDVTNKAKHAAGRGLTHSQPSNSLPAPVRLRSNPKPSITRPTSGHVSAIRPTGRY